MPCVSWPRPSDRGRAAATASSASVARSSAPCSPGSPRRMRSPSRKACARRSPRSSRRFRTRSPSASGSPASRRTASGATSCCRSPTPRCTPPSAAGRTAPASPEARSRDLAPSRREVGLDLLHQKDPDTVSHSVHVAILTVEIARALGLDDVRLDDLRTAARLHDIGKLGVPDSILNKAGALDEDEFRIIKTHPVVGRRAAAELGARRARHHRPAASRADRRLRLSRSGFAATRSASRAGSCTPPTPTSR